MNDISKAISALKGSHRGLRQVYAPNSESGVAFVFLHGFRASSLSTWDRNSLFGKEQQFWPCSLGIEKNASVFAFDYQNGWFERSDRASMNFDHVSKELVSELYKKCSRFDELVFFTHSFGGLLFKNMYVRLGESDPGPRSLKPKVRGICSFSCPNNGSSWAVFSRIPLVASQNFKALRKNSPRLKQLDTDFSAAVRSQESPDFRILSYSEHGYVKKVFRVDPDTCKFPHLADISTDIDSPCNHTDICKSVLDDPDRSEPLMDYLKALSLGSRDEPPIGRV